MKIRKISITNVTSYDQTVTFSFDDKLNILIGPNGGGKSNLQKILAMVLTQFFFRQYDFQENANETTIKPVDLWGRKQLQEKLDRFFGNDGDQVISLEVIPEESDLENIRSIANNLDDLNKVREYWEQAEETYPPSDYIDQIRNVGSLKYTIQNLQLELEANTPQWAFREYLRTFNLFKRFASRLPNITLTSPVFFFFSERSFNRSQQFQTQMLTEQNRFATERQAFQAATGENTDLYQLGATHFLRLYRKHERAAAHEQGVTVFDLIKNERDVQLLDKYLKRLGYDWGFATDDDGVAYYFVLKKDEHLITPDKFSSGEKEIVHFLLATFALNVRSGVVIVDEPELHLHPRWQRILLNLFDDLSTEKGNQFIAATHSPIFVTPSTINSVTRVYADKSGASQKVALKDINLPDKKSLVRMINSQNNERMFFADIVVLVEGITDRLVFSAMIEGIAAELSNNQAIEMIDVGGKSNFESYKRLLDRLDTPCFIVADRDYLEQVGSTEVRKLFISDDAGAWKALTDKKSADAQNFRSLLRKAINTEDIDALRKFSTYFETRHRRLKDNLSHAEQELIKVELGKLRQERILVLSLGEIEDYLPAGFSQLNKLVEMLALKDWRENIAADKYEELAAMMQEVLQLDVKDKG